MPMENMNTKTLIMLSIFAALLFIIIYFIIAATQPSTEADAVTDGSGNSITIARANWGWNCNGSKKMASTTQYLTNPNGTHTAETYQVAENNAYNAVSKLCDKRLKCDVEASVATIGFGAAENCPKDLVVDFRCFDYDILRSVKSSEGETVTISCAVTGSGNTQ